MWTATLGGCVQEAMAVGAEALTAACFQIVCLNFGLQITGQRAYLFSVIEFLVPRPVSVRVQPSLRRSFFPGFTWRMHTTSKQQVRSGRSSLGRLLLARACGARTGAGLPEDGPRLRWPRSTFDLRSLMNHII
jgi:hypothetical protein